MVVETKLPLHGNPTYKVIDFNKKPEKKARIRRPTKKKVVAAKEDTPSRIKPHPKQVLLNFFEWRTGIEYCYYDDGNFYTVEILFADEPASLSLMEDLVKKPNPFHCHFSPRNNRLKVYIDKDIEL
ncbi:hypothetical protein [Draconibacterium sp.]|uniref:hypothetical protein n=1 Tax=Draconibacterium sp. TaxID=1965318 RepID=UPI003566B7D6